MLTTNSQVYFNKIKEEITERLLPPYEILWQYVYVLYLGRQYYSYSMYRKEHKFYVHIQKWDGLVIHEGEYFVGVFHLDTIKIHREIKPVPTQKAHEILTFFNKELILETGKTITLDGERHDLYDFKNNKNWQWRNNEVLSNELKQLMDLIGHLEK